MAVSAPRRTTPLRFVLVDDTATFRELLKEALLRRFQPLELRDFANGREALDACLASPPDLLIADLYLHDFDGRDIVRLDDKRYAYVDIEDAHLRARSARWDGDRCFVLWDDDQEEELDYGSLSQAVDHAFYARARGKLRGRIAGPAHHAVAERVIEDGAGFALPAAGKRWSIANGA